MTCRLPPAPLLVFALALTALLLLPALPGHAGSRQAAATGDPAAAEPLPEAPPLPGFSPAEMAAMAEFHNLWRRKVGVPDLVWSPALAATAAEWAGQLQRRGCRMDHRPGNRYGENLAWANDTYLSPEEVVELWADENEDYDPVSHQCQAGATCEHYTQMVWSTTRHLGCALARCGAAEVWVCEYDPPGNLGGKRPF